MASCTRFLSLSPDSSLSPSVFVRSCSDALVAVTATREISRESTGKGLYRITREDRWICIVKSGTLDLAAYAGKSIQVWGLEAPSAGWSLRTINVSRVKLLE